MADKPFYTQFPKGHPDGFCNGVRQATAWRKLLHGKGSASSGLWHDIAAYLLSLGFTPEVSVGQCLFVHKERQIDFGLYVGDIEAPADDDQLQWLKDRFAGRYEIKWLGFNSKNCEESSEKSSTFVGIRTEIDHLNKIVTQDQTQLIRKAAAERFGWDEHRKRFAPQVHNEPFLKLEEGKTAEAKFHKAVQIKTVFLARRSANASTRFGACRVRAARRLNDPVPECEKYVDEALPFLFSTMDQQLVFHCTQDLGVRVADGVRCSIDWQILLMHARSTTGWWIISWRAQSTAVPSA